MYEFLDIRSPLLKFPGILNTRNQGILISPAYGSIMTDNTPIFDWSDMSRASVYELIVDDSISFSSPEININNLSNSTYTVTSSLLDDTYYWKVRCGDSCGNWGSWSNPWSFTISPPTTVTDIDGNIYQTIKTRLKVTAPI